MSIIEGLFYLFCGMGTTLGLLLALYTGWQLLRGKVSEDLGLKSTAQFFVLTVLWVAVSFWGERYFRVKACQEFYYRGYSSYERCIEDYEPFQGDPDAGNNY